MSYRMSDSKLQIMFKGFRNTFFENRIPSGIRARFVSSKELKQLKADAVWKPDTREIHIAKIFSVSEPMTAILLLHEMAHAALSDYVGDHGMIYKAELYRLFMAGADDELL